MSSAQPWITLASRTFTQQLRGPSTSRRPFAYSLGHLAKLGSSQSSPQMVSAAKQLVDKTIAENDVVIFSKTWCGYCRRAKTILAQESGDVKVIELDETDMESEIQSYLRSVNGQGTVPHIYVRQEFIGGCSDLLKVSKAELKAKIAGKA